MRNIIPHRLRKLSWAEKEIWLAKNIKIPENEISRIRKISDIRKRLIESAKIQWEIFNDIHGDLTAWIAGFPHESTVRRVFGSHFNLRKELNLFPKNQILENFSQEDKRRLVTIPPEMSPELAEEIGIHVGDGNLFIKEREGIFLFRVSGHLIDDIIFHEEFIQNLFKKLFNLKLRTVKRPSRNEVSSEIKSKAVACFKRSLGLPAGPKTFIRIPEDIKKEVFLLKCFIRGLVDTDFSLSLNDVFSLRLNTSSKTLAFDTEEALRKLGFHPARFPSGGTTHVMLGKKKDVFKFIEDIGFHNSKHESKFLIWKEFRDCPPFLSTPERLAVLEEKLDFDDLITISEKRRKTSKLNASR